MSSAHTVGFEAALTAAPRRRPRRRRRERAELAPESLETFYDLFAATERVVTVYSQGVNQSSAGTDKVNAIINCHLATGRIGRPGMGPFSVTGQPNAMGGREVGGLANMLAAHMEIENPEHRRIVQDFWGSPAIAPKPGLKAVDLFRAVEDGRVKALWIIGTNPAVSMPDADRVREAIRDCPFVVVSDVCRTTDTTTLAHVLLPAAGLGREGRNGHQFRAAHVAPARVPAAAGRGAAGLAADRAKWRRRMGFGDAFAYASPAEIFREYARADGGRERRPARSRPRRARRHLATTTTTRSRRSNGRAGAARAPRDALLRRRPLLPPPTAGRASSPRPSARRSPATSARFPLSSTPAASATSGTR